MRGLRARPQGRVHCALVGPSCAVSPCRYGLRFVGANVGQYNHLTRGFSWVAMRNGRPDYFHPNNQILLLGLLLAGGAARILLQRRNSRQRAEELEAQLRAESRQAQYQARQEAGGSKN